MLSLLKHCAVKDASDSGSKEHHLDLEVALNGAITMDDNFFKYLKWAVLKGNADALVWNNLLK